MDSDCPCCAPPWSYNLSIRPYTQMKLSPDFEMLWHSDHGGNMDACYVRDGKLYLGGFGASRQMQAQRTDATNARVEIEMAATSNNAFPVYGIAANSLGNIAIASEDSDVFFPGSGNAHTSFKVFDSSGTLIEEDWFGLIAPDANFPGGGARCIAVDDDDNFYVGGHGGFSDGSVGYLRKYGPAGDRIWLQFGFFATFDSRIYGVATNNATITAVGAPGHEGFFPTGSLYNVKQYDMSGAEIWKANTTVVGQIAYGVAYLSDGSVVVVGGRDNSGHVPITAFDDTGTVIWTVEWATSEVNGVAVDSDDNIYAVGGGDPGNVHLKKYDSGGTLLRTFDYKLGRIAAGVTPALRAISLDDDGNIYIAGDSYRP